MLALVEVQEAGAGLAVLHGDAHERLGGDAQIDLPGHDQGGAGHLQIPPEPVGIVHRH